MTAWLLCAALAYGVPTMTPEQIAALLEQTDDTRRPDSLLESIATAAQEQAKQDAGPNAAPVPAAGAGGFKLPSQDTKKSKALRWGAILAGQGADAATTMKALRNPNIVERNSGIYGDNPSDARILATKGLLSGGMGMLMDHAAKGNKKAANIGAAAVGLAGLIPAIMNLRTMSKVKK